MKYSIIIPAYKSDYLEDAITSICNQSYHNWEMIILNDHSPYDLESIISKFVDERIHFFKNDENVGAINVVNNWNKCLSLCSGDYVICMGDDDLLTPDCLEVYSKYIIRYPDVNVFHTRSIIIDEYGEKAYITDARPEKESLYAMMMHRMKEEQFIGDFCIRTSVLKNEGGYFFLPLAWGSDDMTAYKCICGRGVVNVQEPIFCYRKTAVNITSTGNVSLKIEALNLLYKTYLEVLEIPPSDPVLLLEYKYVMKNLNRYFVRRKAEDISMELRANISRFVWWLIYRKKYDVSFGCLSFALCLAIGSKFK